MEDGTSLKDEIKKLNDNIIAMSEKKEKEKKFKFPSRAKVNNKKARDGYTTVVYINENGEVDFSKQKIEEGTIMKNGTPHVATADYRLSYRGKPLMIVPSWSIEPFSPQKHYDETVKEKKLTVGYKLILNALLKEQIKPKVQMNWVIWVVVLIVLGFGGYYLISKGGLF